MMSWKSLSLPTGRGELADRERDERELVDRRAILLFRRAQDGEMHEIDRGVGLEQIAPGARSPGCGSPETSSTRSLSRTPSIETTPRLLTR
jgi:hypothetical protein